MRHIPSLIIVLFLFTGEINGQYYNTGQEPASVRWLRLKTDNFDVIYPEKYGKKGIEFSRTLEESYASIISMFPEKRTRIPVVIHNLSTRSNGYVAWAPMRMEIYPAPDQNSIPGSQHRLLSIHELTHVLEMESLNTGFSRILSYLMGEQVTGAVAALLPLWYLEGNAVVAETILSSSGRGRNPSFNQQLKAIAVDRGNYRYDKILNGSFRDHIPDHYQSGYQMTAWAMAKYDTGIWNKVLKFTGEQPFTINPVNISLRKNAGLTKKGLYNETFDTLRNLWSANLSGVKENYNTLNPRKDSEYINYYSPVTAGADSIIAIKTSMSSTPEFVLISSGAEKTIYRPGSMNLWLISSGGGRILWVEDRPDPRWANRNYVIIRSFNLKSGSSRSITGKSRYLSASISPDGRKIAAVENTPDHRNNLVFIDSETGNVISSVPSPENLDIQRPQWFADGTGVTVIFLTQDGEGIKSYSLKDNLWLTVLQEGTADLQSSFLRNDSLFFVSAISGTDNIWLKTPGNDLKQISDSRFGIRDIHLNGSRIFFSDYTAAGNELCMKSLSGPAFQSETANPKSEFIIDRIDKPAARPVVTDAVKYNPEPYRKWAHLFRFHSWMPFYADIKKIQTDPMSIRPGITLMSQNILSTMESTLGYEYSSAGSHILHSELTWYGWYPVIKAGFDYGYMPAVAASANVTVRPGMNFSGDISLPLMFSSGNFSQYLRLTIHTDYSNNVYPRNEGGFDYGQTNITARVYFSNYSGTAFRDIYPRWAQTIDLNSVSAPFENNIFGSSSFIRTSFFFPGIFRDHGLRIRIEGERQVQSKFLFANRVTFPRGYNNGFHENKSIISREINTITADYVLPLVYPDLSLASLFYLKRVRAGLFFDNAVGKGNRYYITNNQGVMIQNVYHNFSETFRSYGLELLADFHLFRIPFMISGGVQAAWTQDNNKPVLAAIFNMDLYGFSIGKN